MKEKNCKKEIREQIVETAQQLFIEHGIKDVKMDDIAAQLSISKRTIYELFNDKEQLLREVLELQNDKMRENGKEISCSSRHWQRRERLWLNTPLWMRRYALAIIRRIADFRNKTRG